MGANKHDFKEALKTFKHLQKMKTEECKIDSIFGVPIKTMEAALCLAERLQSGEVTKSMGISVDNEMQNLKRAKGVDKAKVKPAFLYSLIFKAMAAQILKEVK